MGMSAFMAERSTNDFFNGVGNFNVLNGVTVFTASATLTTAEAGPIVCNATAAITLTLPAASSGKFAYFIVNMGTATVTIAPNGTDTVWSTSVAASKSVTLLSNGVSNWGYAGHPPKFWLALFTTNPSAGTPGTEANYTGYARIEVDPTSANWTITNNTGTSPYYSQGKNAAIVTFPSNTGTAQTVTAYGLADALTVGDIFTQNTLTSSQTVNNGVAPAFAAGALTIEFIIAP